MSADPFESLLQSLETQYRADLQTKSSGSSGGKGSRYSAFLQKHGYKTSTAGGERRSASPADRTGEESRKATSNVSHNATHMDELSPFPMGTHGHTTADGVSPMSTGGLTSRGGGVGGSISLGDSSRIGANSVAESTVSRPRVGRQHYDLFSPIGPLVFPADEEEAVGGDAAVASAADGHPTPPADDRNDSGSSLHESTSYTPLKGRKETIVVESDEEPPAAVDGKGPAVELVTAPTVVFTAEDESAAAESGEMVGANGQPTPIPSSTFLARHFKAPAPLPPMPDYTIPADGDVGKEVTAESDAPIQADAYTNHAVFDGVVECLDALEVLRRATATLEAVGISAGGVLGALKVAAPVPLAPPPTARAPMVPRRLDFGYDEDEGRRNEEDSYHHSQMAIIPTASPSPLSPHNPLLETKAPSYDVTEAMLHDDMASDVADDNNDDHANDDEDEGEGIVANNNDVDETSFSVPQGSPMRVVVACIGSDDDEDEDNEEGSIHHTIPNGTDAMFEEGRIISEIAATSPLPNAERPTRKVPAKGATAHTSEEVRRQATPSKRSSSSSPRGDQRRGSNVSSSNRVASSPRPTSSARASTPNTRGSREGSAPRSVSRGASVGRTATASPSAAATNTRSGSSGRPSSSPAVATRNVHADVDDLPTPRADDQPRRYNPMVRKAATPKVNMKKATSGGPNDGADADTHAAGADASTTKKPLAKSRASRDSPRTVAAVATRTTSAHDGRPKPTRAAQSRSNSSTTSQAAPPQLTRQTIRTVTTTEVTTEYARRPMGTIQTLLPTCVGEGVADVRAPMATPDDSADAGSSPTDNDGANSPTMMHATATASSYDLLDPRRLERTPNPDAWLLSCDGAPSTMGTPEKGLEEGATMIRVEEGSASRCNTPPSRAVAAMMGSASPSPTPSQQARTSPQAIKVLTNLPRPVCIAGAQPSREGVTPTKAVNDVQHSRVDVRSSPLSKANTRASASAATPTAAVNDSGAAASPTPSKTPASVGSTSATPNTEGHTPSELFLKLLMAKMGERRAAGASPSVTAPPQQQTARGPIATSSVPPRGSKIVLTPAVTIGKSTDGVVLGDSPPPREPSHGARVLADDNDGGTHSPITSANEMVDDDYSTVYGIRARGVSPHRDDDDTSTANERGGYGDSPPPQPRALGVSPQRSQGAYDASVSLVDSPPPAGVVGGYSPSARWGAAMVGDSPTSNGSGHHFYPRAHSRSPVGAHAPNDSDDDAYVYAPSTPLTDCLGLKGGDSPTPEEEGRKWENPVVPHAGVVVAIDGSSLPPRQHVAPIVTTSPRQQGAIVLTPISATRGPLKRHQRAQAQEAAQSPMAVGGLSPGAGSIASHSPIPAKGKDIAFPPSSPSPSKGDGYGWVADGKSTPAVSLNTSSASAVDNGAYRHSPTAQQFQRSPAPSRGDNHNYTNRYDAALGNGATPTRTPRSTSPPSGIPSAANSPTPTRGGHRHSSALQQYGSDSPPAYTPADPSVATTMSTPSPSRYGGRPHGTSPQPSPNAFVAAGASGRSPQNVSVMSDGTTVAWHTVDTVSPFANAHRTANPTRHRLGLRDPLLLKAEREVVLACGVYCRDASGAGVPTMGPSKRVPLPLRKLMTEAPPSTSVAHQRYPPKPFAAPSTSCHDGPPLGALIADINDDTAMVLWAAQMDVYDALGWYNGSH